MRSNNKEGSVSMMMKKTLMVGIQMALSVGLASTAQAANNQSGVNLTSGGFSYDGGVNLTNSQLKFRVPTSDSYGVLSVTNGDFAGTGSTITMNTFLDAGGTTVANQGSNRLLVNGNASGMTMLVVNNNGGPGASTDLNGSTFNDANEGISLAQVSGTSSAGVFALQGDYVAVGPYQYRLYAYAPGASDAGQRLVDADADGHWDYRLQNAQVATGVAPPAPPVVPVDPVAPVVPSVPTAPVAPVAPPPNVRAGLVPQAPSYLTHNNALLSQGQQVIASLHQRVGETGGAHVRGDSNAEVHVRAFGSDARYSSNLSAAQYGYDYQQDVQGLQIGSDWLTTLGADAGSSLRLGVVYSQSTAHTDPESVYGVKPTVDVDGRQMPIEISREKTRAENAAITATWQHASGFYLDGIAGAGKYKSDVTTPFRDGRVARLDSNDVFASLEAGFGWKVSPGVTIEPQAQVSWQKLDTDRTTDVDGVVVDLGTPEQFVWRVGARALFSPAVGPDGSALTQYVKLAYQGSEGPQQRALLSGERFETGEYGHTAEAGYGLTLSFVNGVSFFADAVWQRDIGGASREGWRANGGLRWAF
jgi:autotransporter family porin